MDFCIAIDFSGVNITVDSSSDEGKTTRFLYDKGRVLGLVVGHSDISDKELAGWSEASADMISSRAITADGNFICVFWGANTLRVVTDSSGSIPLYYAYEGAIAALGTTANEVARKAGGKPLDTVSVADFMQNGAVCHPFSLYEGVRVCPPGAITVLAKEGMQFAHYWLPEEAVEEEELAEYADSLKQNVSTWLTASLAETAKVTVMFSGGEDSRALINLLPAGPEYQLKTIVDGVNREYRLAQRSARKLGYPVKLIERPMGHYSQDIVEKVLWAGAGLDVRHYHIFNKTADIVGDSAALVGGLGSDKLFKSLFMNNVGNKQKTGFLPETLLSEYGLVPTNIGLPKDLGWLNQPLQDAVWQRRTAHHEKILTFRPRTAGNWHTLWPLGWHSPGHSQFLNNMRFGPRVVEPFIASRNYRLAARIPEKYKIDRKLFNAAFLPLMGAASWVPTTSGRVPAITGVNGRAVQFCIKSWRVMLDELLKYISKEKYISQGPWGNDHKYFLVKSPEDVLGKERADMLNDLIGKITIGKSAELFWQQSGKSAQERKVLSLQVGALFNASSNLLRNEKFSQSFRLSADTT